MSFHSSLEDALVSRFAVALSEEPVNRRESRISRHVTPIANTSSQGISMLGGEGAIVLVSLILQLVGSIVLECLSEVSNSSIKCRRRQLRTAYSHAS